LEILGPMKPPKVMAIVVFWRGSAAIFRDRIHEEDKEELQAIYYQDLFRIFPNNMIVWYPPSGGVVFHSLRSCQFHPRREILMYIPY
jgi:hypothetical protein